MELTPVGIVIVAVWAVALSRGLAAAGAVAIALIPFGTAAVINLPALGDLSLLGAQVAAGLTSGMALLLYFTDGRTNRSAGLSPAAVLLALFALYGVLSGYFLPRIFHGDFLVVPLARISGGMPISGLFPTRVIPLAPSTSNISQPAYLIGSVMFFVTALWFTRRRGLSFTSTAVQAAATVNAVLAALDLADITPVMEFIRTANYSVLAGIELSSFRRVVGGFPEASVFGLTTTAFFAYCGSMAMDLRRPATIALAIVSGVLALASFSSTAILGVGLTGAFLGARALADFGGNRVGHSSFLGGGALGALGACALLALLALPPVTDVVFGLIETLILDKSASESGLERGAWAAYGMDAFRQTYGLGAGLGSIRANGLPAVLLGNMGLPGAVLFAAFLWVVYLRPLPRVEQGGRRARAYFRAAFAASLSTLAMQTASSTTADPGLLFFTFAALALCAREALGALARQNALGAFMPETPQHFRAQRRAAPSGRGGFTPPRLGGSQ